MFQLPIFFPILDYGGVDAPRMSLIAEIFVGIEANEKAIVPSPCAALLLIEL